MWALLLTTRLEAFTVGNTIVVSRGLIDVLPSESAVALVLAHQIAHNVLGHRKVDSKFAFADVLRISDAELLAKLRFHHSLSEEAAADAKALKILEQSPYRNTMSDGGLAMQALQVHAKQLSNLIQPNLGEHVADVEQVVRNNEMFRTAPVHDEELVAQVAGLPLGSKLVVNSWNGRVELFRSEPLAAPALYERAEFAVTPFMPFLDLCRREVECAQTAKRDHAAGCPPQRCCLHSVSGASQEADTPRAGRTRAYCYSLNRRTVSKPEPIHCEIPKVADLRSTFLLNSEPPSSNL
jgi:hypothetical protein